MTRNQLELPVGVSGTRLFVGFRAEALAEAAADTEAQRQEKRRKFFDELGGTFMPGTPLMQAPLGLAAYMPVVLDPPSGSGLPDEVAAIVYASREVYDRYRDSSLSRRMYTRSHVAVFNMPKSAATFVGPAATPAPLTAQGVQYQFAHLFGDATVDWQSGHLKVGFVVPGDDATGFRADILARFADGANAAKAWDVDQALIAVTDTFAAIWIHAGHELDGAFQRLALVPPGARLLRDLDAQQAPVRGDAEKGITVNGPIALTYRFERRLDLFDLPVPAA